MFLQIKRDIFKRIDVNQSGDCILKSPLERMMMSQARGRGWWSGPPRRGGGKRIYATWRNHMAVVQI